MPEDGTYGRNMQLYKYIIIIIIIIIIILYNI
jgi:hypothetical protein